MNAPAGRGLGQLRAQVRIEQPLAGHVEALGLVEPGDARDVRVHEPDACLVGAIDRGGVSTGIEAEEFEGIEVGQWLHESPMMPYPAMPYRHPADPSGR